MSEPSGIIDPSAARGGLSVAPAQRPASLAGRVLALLDNTKEQGDVILDALAGALRERHGVARVIARRKAHYSRTAPASLLDEIAREAQIAIAALGG